ncbi:MAG TPA: tRNA uridine(34) 5-carboxymethylaminomethyl modification radical SAM/GNAT enzyme Elp3 [Candidatus Nanoarchaeia archaeon]|nr:tRNA uridine(34) 5-carboxymethylaminomethyl modification radical SAM/GNAT enzyme Elp3 [Candidatus Nanoarchaeia archaeon]
MKEAAQELLIKVEQGIPLERAKGEVSKKYHLPKMLTNIEILNELSKEERKKYASQLITKPRRTASGVFPIAVMSAPFACSHGKCIFCCGGPNSVFGDVPQSYTGHEPSTMRAIRANYDPYLIVFNRLEQYVILGRIPEKCDVIIQGGTFPALAREYQDDFIANIFKAMNDFSERFFSKEGEFEYEMFKEFFELPGSIKDAERTKRIHEKIKGLKGTSELEREQERNEYSKIRCIGLTIETKPDWGLLKEGNEMLRQGCTRVEVGIQTVYEDIIQGLNRGHTVEETKESIRVLKDLGFKINGHYMLGLPRSDEEKDLLGLKELFENAEFRPDMVKIYPCLVIKGTPLFELWKRGKYGEISVERAARTIAFFKMFVPEYVRIMRVQRDIASTVIDAGPIKTNLRQEVEKICKKENIHCKCIRCREAGFKSVENPEVKVLEYEASEGKEFFISLEKDNVLIGYCRVRFPSQCLREEITEKSAIIRELHIYSDALPLGERAEKSLQHRGFGKRLMEAAERIAKEKGKEKMLVISGIGVKEYYRKLGYKKEGPYMAKTI